ncbi:putative sporulation protein YyaC [Desulfosporosinus acidiphilus SJ4]|uniref:Putative sporulation protein YyaC n=1 Tax=Desulfosporosinus acidiphilus (strain DSM 22704 / JCM 16185 / SJ4) TaxID=646529 RepID=I4D0P0_DESAJ|nr:spore protease YyaC [Desulfosporosinus acidiphilus]AFM39364.1 putative sporulation protein YyaC [Desulfosporosinus acidiphilus SJ4]
MGVMIIQDVSRRIHVSVNSFIYNIRERQSFVSSLQELSCGKRVLFACIGTDRATGDSLGPLVGTNLKRSGHTVLGTLEEPLHAQNLIQKLNEVSANLQPDLIIAIDACLGRAEDIGKITLADSPLIPGAAVHKNLPTVGDISILGVVNVGGFCELQVLQGTRLHTVMKLANDITHLIWRAIPISHGYSTLRKQGVNSFS